MKRNPLHKIRKQKSRLKRNGPLRTTLTTIMKNHQLKTFTVAEVSTNV